MREIKAGTVLMRFLLPFAVWHYGIVIAADSQNANDIFMLEFADGNKITNCTLKEFMYGRLFFWIDDFHQEYKKYGPNIFYSVSKRIKRALQIQKDNHLAYSINKYNCEYYVRKCVFREQRLWPSRQTSEIGKDRVSLFSKVGLIIAYGISDRIADMSKWEENLSPTEWKFIVCPDCAYMRQIPRGKHFDAYICRGCKRTI